jgi:Nickel-containing superoxide dismutase
LYSAATKLISRSGNRIQFAVRRVCTASTLASTSTRSRHPMASVVAVTAAAVAFAFQANRDTKAFLHCQVPCGIFDDKKLVAELTEAATTVRKAMVESNALGEKLEGIQAMNQVVRWIVTKEQHCDKIIHLMGDYCLCQRVKPTAFVSETDYLLALKLHHKVMIAAMKAKQTMDTSACDDLDHALEDVAKMYTA